MTKMIFVAAPAKDICEAGWLNWFNAELSLKRYCSEIPGGGGQGGGCGGGGGTLTNDAPYRHHQHDCSIKMGSDESHFNASSTVRDKITLTVSTKPPA